MLVFLYGCIFKQPCANIALCPPGPIVSNKRRFDACNACLQSWQPPGFHSTKITGQIHLPNPWHSLISTVVLYHKRFAATALLLCESGHVSAGT